MWNFKPADQFTDRHGLFIALEGEPNSGKTYSALKLARGIAGPEGEIAVLDTEGGRTLHLKGHFKFDVNLMDPPFRPQRFAEAAYACEEAGYAVMLIDSFSMEWAGLGGVLDWQAEILSEAIERARAKAKSNNWSFDEAKAANANKLASWIAPKSSHKAMVYSFLQRRMPIIFSIRGEHSIDPDTKKETFKLITSKAFPFEVTVSFRLKSAARGIIDLSDSAAYKMEGPHQEIFIDGDQLSERHGAALAAWARGEDNAVAAAPPAKAPSSMAASAPIIVSGNQQSEQASPAPKTHWEWVSSTGAVNDFKTRDNWIRKVEAGISKCAAPDDVRAAIGRNAAVLDRLRANDDGGAALQVEIAADNRAKELERLMS